MPTIVDGLDGSLIDRHYLTDLRESLGTAVGIHVTVNNVRKVTPSPSLADAVVDLGLWLKRLRDLQGVAHHVHTMGDLDALESGLLDGVGIILGYQNSNWVGEHFEVLDLLRTSGVRVLQITHNSENLYGFGCTAPEDRGLTELGRVFVEHCNELGITVDLSHTGDQTCLDVISHSKRPVAVTHSNASAVLSHPRNRSDEVIRAIAARGGVFGVTFLPTLLAPNGAPTLDAVIEHIWHIYQIGGAETISFGSDFITNQDHGDRYEALKQQKGVYDFEHMNYPIERLSRIEILGDALAKRGMPPDAVEGFFGRNLIRVLRDTWNAKAQ